MNFVHVLDPKYQIPSRQTIMRRHLPELYEASKQHLAELFQAKYCALTSDLWTSQATEGYITPTCHFVSSSTGKLETAVLGTMCMVTNHTADNIATTLKHITDEWDISDKVCCIVTDNANNIVAATRLNAWKHIPCFAHTLNLIVTESIAQDQELRGILKRSRDIVTYFHHSDKATRSLSTVQSQLKMENHKLIQDVSTRWNSVFFMMERMIEQHQAVTTTLCLLDRNAMCLSTSDIETMKKAVEVLRPFETATRELSAEKYVTASKVIPIARSLQEMTARKSSTLRLSDNLILQMRRRFTNMERHCILSAITLLDPHLKKLAFRDPGAADECARRLTNELALLDTNQAVALEEPLSSPSNDSGGLWNDFDQLVSEASSR